MDYKVVLIAENDFVLGEGDLDAPAPLRWAAEKGVILMAMHAAFPNVLVSFSPGTVDTVDYTTAAGHWKASEREAVLDWLARTMPFLLYVARVWREAVVEQYEQQIVDADAAFAYEDRRNWGEHI